MAAYKFLKFLLLTTFLSGCDRQDSANTSLYQERKTCKESTRDIFETKCFPRMRMISKNYALMDGEVYWVNLYETSNIPCSVGSPGDLTGMAILFSPRCWIERSNQLYHTKEYKLNYVTTYSPEFHVLEAVKKDSPKWQIEQVESYAIDGKSVYFEGRIIERARPNNFSVIFPFGAEGKWRNFNVSKSGDLLFMGGVSSESVELEGFNYFEPVQCPGHGLPCTSKKDPDYLFRYLDYRSGVLGWIGKDVVFLREDGIDVYRGKFYSDTFMFLSVKRIYLFSAGKFYELRQFDQGYSYDKRGFLVDMDFGYFRKNNY